MYPEIELGWNGNTSSVSVIPAPGDGGWGVAGGLTHYQSSGARGKPVNFSPINDGRSL